MKILVLNSGSSSLKYQVIDMESEKVLAKGNFERIGQARSFLTHKVNGEKHKFEMRAENHEEAIRFVLKRLTNENYGVMKSLDELIGIGHRVVHGGEKFTEPVIITDEVIDTIKECTELAPLHNPSAILGMEACKRIVPNIKMVAVFDTAFHQTIPKERYLYPIPYEYYEKYGIRKYGFHGTSHKYVAYRVAELMGKDVKDLKIINCHLGQGGSICAIQNGKSVDTSMGLTPLGGIVMERHELNAREMETILNKESGVYGVSGVSVDFRDIEVEAASGDKNSQRALDIFHDSVAGYVAKYMVAMGGADVITFTAGVGEKGQDSRQEICNRLKYFGIKLDEKHNQEIKGDEDKVSSEDSSIPVYVVPTNEELMIARETKKCIEEGERK